MCHLVYPLGTLNQASTVSYHPKSSLSEAASPHRYSNPNVCQAVCLLCAVLPRHQVHAGICHTGSAQLRSPHYPLWTRTGVISFSVSPPPSSPPPLSLPLFLSPSCIIPLSFLVYLNLFLSSLFRFYDSITSHPPSPPCILSPSPGSLPVDWLAQASVVAVGWHNTTALVTLGLAG